MLLVLVLIGLNMRPLLTSVGPLLPQLQQATGISFGVASLLTALPVVAMGIMALTDGWMGKYFNERNSVALSLLMIAIGALLRESAPRSSLLLSSALLGGIGIGMIQTIMPTIIKRLFSQRMPQVIGLWSATLMGGGGLGAALTPWLAQHSYLWYHALAWWGLPAIIALIGWWLQCNPLNSVAHISASTLPVRIHISPRAWVLGLYFGLINGGYTSLIAWLPPYYIQLGFSAQSSGSLLALMTLGQTLGALILPMLANRQDRRGLLLLTLVLQLIGFCGFIWLPQQFSILWAVVCGIGLGGAFPLCLVLALDHSPHNEITRRLVSFMQGVGFIIAGLSPYLSGLLRSLSGNYLLDWMLHAGCIIGLIVLTLRFTPSRYPQQWRTLPP
ncbi:cyanate transporter [Yersinia alsatica]|uniref:Cyanate transporter n=1 Tax=Yersinia alsatica TaxID=2890317 RepID=A0ABY5UVA9_9GAMM|nr:cyanate transporter [Yersinia alsatica]UWM47414.1 cyanate transporter [Yersinia alsatica]